MSRVSVKRAEFIPYNADKLKVGIIAAQFNRDITEELLSSTVKILTKYKVKKENILIRKVAGCVEIPVMLQALAESKKFDCLVALGAVIYGETPHFDYVCKIVSEGVLRIQLDYKIPVGFGVLTLDNKKQAEARLNVGGEAAEAALHLVKEIKNL